MEETGYCNDATATVPAPQAAAPRQAKKPRPKARKAAPALDYSTADLNQLMSAVIRAGEVQGAAELVERAQESDGVIYLIDDGGRVGGVLVAPDAYDRLLSEAQHGRD